MIPIFFKSHYLIHFLLFFFINIFFIIFKSLLNFFVFLLFFYPFYKFFEAIKNHIDKNPRYIYDNLHNDYKNQKIANLIFKNRIPKLNIIANGYPRLRYKSKRNKNICWDHCHIFIEDHQIIFIFVLHWLVHKKIYYCKETHNNAETYLKHCIKLAKSNDHC